MKSSSGKLGFSPQGCGSQGQWELTLPTVVTHRMWNKLGHLAVISVRLRFM